MSFTLEGRRARERGVDPFKEDEMRAYESQVGCRGGLNGRAPAEVVGCGRALDHEAALRMAEAVQRVKENQLVILNLAEVERATTAAQASRPTSHAS